MASASASYLPADGSCVTWRFVRSQARRGLGPGRGQWSGKIHAPADPDNAVIPTRGRAQVCGFDVAREPTKVRLHIGYDTGADACFYSRLSAREYLILFADLNNLSGAEASRRIADLSGPFGLSELLDRQVRTLSTGNIHRLGLARAMLHQPSVLMLDETTRSLDPLHVMSKKKSQQQYPGGTLLCRGF